MDITSLNYLLCFCFSCMVFFIWLGFYPENLNFLMNRIANNQEFDATIIEQQNKEFALFALFLPLAQKLSKKNSKNISVATLNKIDLDLDAAGRPLKIKAIEFYNMRYSGALIIGILALLMGTVALDMGLILFPIGAIIGYVMPQIKLNQIIRKRAEIIDAELPNVLDLISVCMASGMTLLKSLEIIFSKNEGLLIDELKIVVSDISGGMVKAFESLSVRCRTKRIQKVLQSVKLSEQFGTPIATALKVLSDSIREETFELVKQRAAKAASLVLLPVLIFILPSIVIFLIGPIIPSFMK